MAAQDKTCELTRRFYSVRQVVEVYPGLTIGGVRHAIFNNLNGFTDRCVCRFGRKVLIDADALDAWLEDHRGGAA